MYRCFNRIIIIHTSKWKIQIFRVFDISITIKMHTIAIGEKLLHTSITHDMRDN